MAFIRHPKRQANTQEFQVPQRCHRRASTVIYPVFKRTIRREDRLDNPVPPAEQRGHCSY